MESILDLLFCFLYIVADYRMTEYCEFEGTHKDHQGHLLSGCSIWGWNLLLCVLLAAWSNQQN